MNLRGRLTNLHAAALVTEHLAGGPATGGRRGPPPSTSSGPAAAGRPATRQLQSAPQMPWPVAHGAQPPAQRETARWPSLRGIGRHGRFTAATRGRLGPIEERVMGYLDRPRLRSFQKQSEPQGVAPTSRPAAPPANSTRASVGVASRRRHRTIIAAPPTSPTHLHRADKTRGAKSNYEEDGERKDDRGPRVSARRHQTRIASEAGWSRTGLQIALKPWQRAATCPSAHPADTQRQGRQERGLIRSFGSDFRISNATFTSKQGAGGAGAGETAEKGASCRRPESLSSSV